MLLTGATGFVGRYLALELLQQMEQVDGKLICLVRARSDGEARRRLEATFDSGDGELLRHFQELAADHLEVIAGDKGEANLGLDHQTWQRLADTVDLIVDSAAVVNAVLPYSELFGPNVVGTAELIRIALTTKLKSYRVRVDRHRRRTDRAVVVHRGCRHPGHQPHPHDRRRLGRRLRQQQVGGRGAAARGQRPVRAARHGISLRHGHGRYHVPGQLNLSDTVTRMALSLVATGIAPGSFYELDSEGNRQRAHFDGLPVEFVAEAIATLGARHVDGFQTYHVMNPHDDGHGLDEFVDWLIDAGHPIERVDDFDEWLRRLGAGLRALPDRQRQHSVLPLLLLLRNSNYLRPRKPKCGSYAPADRFRAAVQEAKIGSDKINPDIPHVWAPTILKYVTDLQLLGLL